MSTAAFDSTSRYQALLRSAEASHRFKRQVLPGPRRDGNVIRDLRAFWVGRKAVQSTRALLNSFHFASMTRDEAAHLLYDFYRLHWMFEFMVKFLDERNESLGFLLRTLHISLCRIEEDLDEIVETLTIAVDSESRAMLHSALKEAVAS